MAAIFDEGIRPPFPKNNTRASPRCGAFARVLPLLPRAARSPRVHNPSIANFAGGEEWRNRPAVCAGRAVLP